MKKLKIRDNIELLKELQEVDFTTVRMELNDDVGGEVNLIFTDRSQKDKIGNIANRAYKARSNGNKTTEKNIARLFEELLNEAMPLFKENIPEYAKTKKMKENTDES